VANCGALAAGLIESELFGHVRGAFTGAVCARAGRLTEVGSGTLMLDDVEGLPASLQIKLLRAVEERVFEPVGSNKPQPMQARLIAASNRDLKEEAAAGRFRLDLYYRLNVVEFHLPALRQRRNVIAPLARQFLAEFAGQNGRPVHRLADCALHALEDYDWPGNVRELRNVIERAVALCPGQEVRRHDLPDYLHQNRSATAFARHRCKLGSESSVSRGRLTETVAAVEADHISEALGKHKYNRRLVAKELGISRVTLYKKMRKYGLLPSNTANQQ
jgi:DNA-binding NtrC family response regulator